MPENNLELAFQRWPELTTVLRPVVGAPREPLVETDWPEWWKERYARSAERNSEAAAHLLLLGLDCPRELQALLELWGEELLDVTVLEPYATHLRWLIEQPEFEPFLKHPRFHLQHGLDAHETLERLVPRGPSVGVNGLETATAPSLADGTPGLETLRVAVERWANEERQLARVRLKQKGRPLANALMNTVWLPGTQDLSLWKDRLEGCPAFLIGAGPSLDDALPTLRQASGHGAIIAVDTALTSLLRAGITPDILVTLDPTPANAQHFAGLQVPPETAVAWSPEVFRGVLESLEPGHPNVVVPDDGNAFTTAVAQEMGITLALPRSPQTGELSYRLAALLGCDPIVLIGYDLAFSDTEGATHARDCVLRREMHATDQANRRQVTGIEGVTGAFETQIEQDVGVAGEPIAIPAIFRLYRERLEALIAERQGTTIDAGGRGAKKRGTKIATLESVLVELPAREPADLMRGVIPSVDRTNRTATVSLWLQRAENALRSALGLAPEFQQALAAWPDGSSVTLPEVLRAVQRAETAWKRLRTLDLYDEVLEPCLMHLMLENLRAVRSPGKTAAEMSVTLRNEQAERMQQLFQTLQGFLTFTKGGRDALA